jgi:hypothetical protein
MKMYGARCLSEHYVPRLFHDRNTQDHPAVLQEPRVRLNQRLNVTAAGDAEEPDVCRPGFFRLDSVNRGRVDRDE